MGRVSVRPSVNNSVFSIFSRNTWPTKLKLCRMILDISAQSPCFCDFLPGGAVGRAHFEIYSSYPIELKLGRMILVISPHNRSVWDFRFSPGGAVRVRVRVRK